MRIVSVVGARPNFMKIAPFVRAVESWRRQPAEYLEQRGQAAGNAATAVAAARATTVEHLLVHTGQHYDTRMSDAFFRDLDIPQPDIHLEIGSGTHAEQVGKTMIAFESVLQEVDPDWVIVVGDVNATCACSITAKKHRVRVAHIEAGLRSFDMDMPEEINRLVTDRLSDLLFATDEIACRNLQKEGVPDDRIHLVGNIMIDTLLTHRQRAAELDLQAVLAEAAVDGTLEKSAAGRAMQGEPFAVMTLHRPSNVDDPAVLGPLVDYFTRELAPQMPLLWPIHPRTRGRLEAFDLWEKVREAPNVLLLEPVGYHAMLKLNLDARLMLTDSGGLQEECCVLGTPCLTLRWNTERPVTLVEHGGLSELVGNDVALIRSAFTRALNRPPVPHAPALWDGRAARRIADVLLAARGVGE